MGLDWLQALLLGLVEGITEFLPISSTGHLILVSDWLNVHPENPALIMLQGAAILAVMWEYRVRLFRTASQVKESSSARRFFIGIALAFLPLACLGLLFKKQIAYYLFSPLSVGIVLLVGGILMWILERYYFKNHRHTTSTPENISLKQAFGIGLIQSLALIPGTSRSAATLLGGMWLGLSRAAAAEFSFFLAIPTLLAATAYQGYKTFGQFSHNNWGYLLIGCVVAFISALLAVRSLVRWLSQHDLTGFAWYRIVLGLILIGFYWK